MSGQPVMHKNVSYWLKNNMNALFPNDGHYFKLWKEAQYLPLSFILIKVQFAAFMSKGQGRIWQWHLYLSLSVYWSQDQWVQFLSRLLLLHKISFLYCSFVCVKILHFLSNYIGAERILFTFLTHWQQYFTFSF